MTASDQGRTTPEHPWRTIDLAIYERHMSDARVGQLQQLHDITAAQLATHPSRSVAILGVAAGNGLDLIDPRSTEMVFGYDINAEYLRVCEARHREVLGDRLRPIEASIDQDLTIERADLVIANLIIEYVGTEEFAAFAARNKSSIGVLSCVIQRNDAAGFVSETEDSGSFGVLATVASDVDVDMLESLLTAAGFAAIGRWEYSLPNGKTLIRQDFRPEAAAEAG